MQPKQRRVRARAENKLYKRSKSKIEEEEEQEGSLAYTRELVIRYLSYNSIRGGSKSVSHFNPVSCVAVISFPSFVLAL